MLGRLATTIPIVALWLPTSLQAANPWPGESSSAALKLTSLDPEFTSDISGAYWNGTARTFWVCRNNPGTFWALQQNSNGIWQIATNASRTKARWAAGGDLEGICQVNDSDPSVYVMDENGWIRQYNVANYGVVSQIRAWDIRAYCPENPFDGTGPESITFVPDDWLRHEGFRDNSGTLRTSSNGLGA